MSATEAGVPVFRSAALTDAEVVEALLMSQALPTAGVAEMFAADPTQFLLALDGNAVIAVVGVEACGEHALLRSVAVRRDWQQRGLGQALVTRAVTQAESRGITALYLLTMTAAHYFPRFGFTPVSREEVPVAIASTVEFTSACPASAIAMCKTLDTHGSTAP